MAINAPLLRFFLCIYLLRAQLLGFALLWPISGLVLQSPMFRGLSDLQYEQLAQVEGIVLVFVVFLVCSTNLVLLHGGERLGGGVQGSGDAALAAGPLAPPIVTRWATPLLGALMGVLFIANVVVDWTTEKVWVSISVAFASFIALAMRDDIGSSIARWSQTSASSLDANPDGSAQGRTVFRNLAVATSALKRMLGRSLTRLLVALGPGYGSGGRAYPGQVLVVVLFLYFLLAFYINGLNFGTQGQRFFGITVVEPWETSGSTLLVALFGMQFAVGLLTTLTFFFDRYRIPVVLVVAIYLISVSLLNNSENTFVASAVKESQLEALLGPADVMAAAPQRVVVVAAAGGGIQASGWTAEVLTRLTEENAGFRQHLKVISGVSGGSVGTVFYLASYPGVWSPKALSMTEVRKAATSSFLEDVAWGLVYPDLHRVILPLAPWGTMDRGRALEAAFARRAGKPEGWDQTVLGLAKPVADGLPVFILNATLTDKALPVVFTNSRFPDPSAKPSHRRAIRSLWHDFRMDTMLETAARLSATFPYISPAARPEALPGVDAFVDGGFFDNSGLYSLMAWLEQAAEGPVATPPREVLVIRIDAFPEPNAQPDMRTYLRWYDQLMLPMTTIVRVRETGQAARTQYEFPLFARSLEGRLRVSEIQFRYAPSPRCALDPPPLSWRLTEFEKECITESWSAESVRAARTSLARWLAQAASN